MNYLTYSQRDTEILFGTLCEHRLDLAIEIDNIADEKDFTDLHEMDKELGSELQKTGFTKNLCDVA